MLPSRPLYLKTYGKQRRKVSAWILPDDRKQAFDSTASTEDVSVFEAPKPKRICVASRRAKRPAKKKAVHSLTERSCDDVHMSNEENIFIPSHPHPPPVQQSKITRGKKTRVSSRRAAGCVVRKSCGLSLTETNSDEDNIRRLSPRLKQTKTTRESRLVSAPGVLTRQKGQRISFTSDSEEETSAPKHPRFSVKMKKDSNVQPSSAGRFVTHRRRAAATKPKLPIAVISLLSSSDDFTGGAHNSSRIQRPTRRRGVRPVFGSSSAENSVTAAGTSTFATHPFREMSLNESADHSPRKPIFCSTPSAGAFSNHRHLKLFPICDQPSTLPSVSVSCIDVLSSFPEDLNSPAQSVSPPSLTGLHSGEKLQNEPHQHHRAEPAVDLFLEPNRSSSSEEAKSHSEDSKTKHGEDLPSVILFPTDSGSSNFVLEWFIEVLKEKCLAERCTVKLERLDYLTVTQLCSETIYSSCLEHLSSIHNQPQSVDSSQTVDLSRSLTASHNIQVSVTNDKSSDCLQSVNRFEEAATVTDSHSSNVSPVVEYRQSAEHSGIKASIEQSESVLIVESTHHTDSSFEMMTANSTVQPLFTADEVEAAKNRCLAKKCSVQINNLTLTQLKGFTQQKEADLSFYENDQTHNMGKPEDMKSSGDKTEIRKVSKNNSRPVAKTQSTDPETEEKAARLATSLKEICLKDKLTVKVKRLSQLREILHPKDARPKPPTVVSDSASDDQTKTVRQSESDSNHSNEDTSSMKVKKRCSTSSEMISDKQAVKNSCDVVPKRQKMSQAPKDKKRRSVSKDRPGTTRKVCVSGMSVSRWKNKGSGSSHIFGSRTAADYSINELISAQHKEPRELLGAAMNFSTPVRASRLNFSSLLADLTPDTHTWSRLKAALSVHRRAMVLVTPRSSRRSPSGPPGRSELAGVSQDLFGTPELCPLPKHLRSQLLSHHSQVICEDAELSDAEKVYAECSQQHPLPWEECILPHHMKRCVKIGEGTFGEVFSTTNASGDTVALKIIPIEGSEKVNGEDQKTFGEILHEIIISKELSSLKEKQHNQTHGFIGLNDLHCVKGCYPPDLLNTWDTFNQRKGSENDRPDFFEKDQIFIILEFEFGGSDLENSNGKLSSLVVAKSILHQVTAAMAVAEQELHFEHRDLHWGNVLVKTTRQKMGSFLLNGTTHGVETKGVLVRIIDYSLSRLEIDDLTVSCDIANDEELFMGQGDYQFDIYRLMRQENGNNWSDYHPHTNVLWLHYLCSKLLSMKYRGTGGRGTKDIREELTCFYDNVLQYSSATEALQNCPMFQ
ncbi:uncharacterized protein haspin [Brachyistius frenatus]|uniref:uncharacterized protein haspin n=1 Tax=Brachyistius frenatus TaxID=100188 RepID=UPI0037E9BD08